MINIEVVDYSAVIAFWLVFARVSAIFLQYPLFDNPAIPNVLKVLICVLISYVFFPSVEAEVLKDINYVGIDNFWILTIFNIGLGLMIGFFVKMIMSIYTSAGSVISQQIGFASLKYFDPTAGAQIGPFEKIMQWTIIILILSSGALIPMFTGCFGTFKTLHIYDLSALTGSITFYSNLFRSIFVSSLMLASPLIFTNLIIMSILGIIARAVPQMNVLMVSFVVNIGVGLLVFISISNEFFTVAYKMYVDKLGEWFQFIA